MNDNTRTQTSELFSTNLRCCPVARGK